MELKDTPFSTTPHPKVRLPDRPELSLVWASLWDGGGIEEGILEAYE